MIDFTEKLGLMLSGVRTVPIILMGELVATISMGV